jgi:uronate dehydrogenase
MSRLLITGAAGGVGTFLCAGLPDLGWTLRGLDQVAAPDAGIEWITGDVRDPDTLDRAMDGVDAVVHLAGIPVEAPFADLLSINIDGSYQLFEAARRAGVSRIIYASSNHAVGFHPRGALADTELRPRPDTYYGLTKVFGEGLASLYVDRHQMQVACLRIGTCITQPITVRHLSTWLSPADGVRLVQAALTAPELTYAVAYGASANTRGVFDLTSARALGYTPEDDSEPYAEAVLAACGPLAEDDPDALYLGGNFTRATA